MTGCRQVTSLTTAAVSQGPSQLTVGRTPGSWTFNGLDARVVPRVRMGSYATATREVPFLDPADLGPHGYRFRWAEQNGIIYTCGAGHVDIAHVRKAADWTGYLAATTLRHLERRETAFRFKLHEPSLYFVELTYPQNWDQRPPEEQESVARELAVRLGQYLAYTGLTWHEILTWFGYQPRPYKSEFPSAFSWEDTYSNLLGTRVAAGALRDREHTFSEAVTLILELELEALGPRPAHVARQAADAMRGKWFCETWFSTTIMKRNFDVGLDDGYVTPCLVPAVPGCEGARPHPLPVPTPESLTDCGFTVKLEIEPRGWEEKRIVKALYPDGGGRTRRLDPAVHFASLIRHIEEDAAARWGRPGPDHASATADVDVTRRPEVLQ